MNNHCPYCRMVSQMIWVRFQYLIQAVLTLEERQHFADMAEGKYQDD